MKRFLAIVITIMAVLALAFALLWIEDAEAQPVTAYATEDTLISTVHVAGETTYSLEVVLTVEVVSSISWETQQVGIYWTTDALEDWNYAGATRDTLIWTAPGDGLTYRFASTVDDDAGNSEGYEFEAEAVTFVCSTCEPPSGDCPPATMISLATDAATLGVTEWGTASTPMARFYWPHPTTGSPVETYTMWLESISQAGDTTEVMFTGLTEMDSLYGYGSIPYPMEGQHIRVWVAGVDSLDRQGPGSVKSNWFGDDGPPGVAGQPRGYLEMVGP